MNKTFERFGYTATLVDNYLTIKNPLGLIVKHTQYKNSSSAIQGWYDWCGRHNLKIRPRSQDTVVIDIKVPDVEEPTPIIAEPQKPINKVANTLPITAIIDFNFSNNQNLPLTEWIKDINERIQAADFIPSEIVRVRLVPNT